VPVVKDPPDRFRLVSRFSEHALENVSRRLANITFVPQAVRYATCRRNAPNAASQTCRAGARSTDIGHVQVFDPGDV
jgi:hypothetical protein